jgi:DNA invertase Pin-like site-specific DNA recombinase
MKGSISEFELGILHSRMIEAARSKARRGELRYTPPIGFIWHREIGLGFDPDIRVQEVIHLIFRKFRELGSARQVGREDPLSASLGRYPPRFLRMASSALP